MAGEPDCEYITNQSAIAEKVYFSNQCYIHKVAFEHLSLATDIAKKQKLILQ